LKGLKVARAKKGWSQQDLADALGMHVNMISRYELSKAYPNLPKLIEMSKVLEISIGELVESNTQLIKEEK
jgi:transcriptional regulator with XRE-family HTH domain